MAQTGAAGAYEAGFGAGIQTARQWRELLQLVSEGLILVDRELRVTEVNHAGLRMAGQSRAEFVGRTLSELAPDMKHSITGRRWFRAMREGRHVAGEQLHSWPDGRTRLLRMRGHPIKAGFAIFWRDVTHERRSEETLKRTQGELIHASRVSAMGTMAASIAHELAQPLASAGTSIDAGLGLMRSLPESQVGEARRALDLAGSSVRRGREILKRMRAFVAKGQVRARTEDLEAIVTDASVLAYPQAERHNVEIRLQSDPEAQWVKADAVQIQQVLFNLIRNAIEAMAPSGEGTITVSTSAASPTMALVSVDDTGPGLDQTAAEDAFAPFNSGKPDGLGIGLSVSRTIVEAHGGTIEVEPSAAGGASFRFTLPRAEAPD